MQTGSYRYRIEKDLNGHDGLRLLNYLRGDHYAWAQQYALLANNNVVQLLKCKFHREKPSEETYPLGIARDTGTTISFECALNEPMDVIHVSIYPALYIPIGVPTMYHRKFVAFPTHIPVVRTCIERERNVEYYRLDLSVEREKRPLVQGIEDALDCELLPVEDVRSWS